MMADLQWKAVDAQWNAAQYDTSFNRYTTHGREILTSMSALFHLRISSCTAEFIPIFIPGPLLPLVVVVLNHPQLPPLPC